MRHRGWSLAKVLADHDAVVFTVLHECRKVMDRVSGYENKLPTQGRSHFEGEVAQQAPLPAYLNNLIGCHHTLQFLYEGQQTSLRKAWVLFQQGVARSGVVVHHASLGRVKQGFVVLDHMAQMDTDWPQIGRCTGQFVGCCQSQGLGQDVAIEAQQACSRGVWAGHVGAFRIFGVEWSCAGR